MKKYLFLVLSLFAAGFINAQAAKEVLQQCREACMKIENGHVKASKRFKFFSKNDTSNNSAEYFFVKKTGDSIAKMHYLYKTPTVTYQYNGIATNVDYENRKVFIDTIEKDNWWRCSDLLRFTTTSTDPIGFINDSGLVIQFVPGYSLHDKKDTIIIAFQGPLDVESCHKGSYYINRKTLLPIRFERFVDFNLQTQYECYTVEFSEFNKKQFTDSIYQFKIPQEMPVKYHEKTIEIPHIPLPIDTVAPSFSGLDLAGDSVILNKLTRKIYLVDFWYRNCYPCLQAMPFIQKMYDTYAEKGLMVMGLNSRDKNDSAFKEFIKYKGFTYPIVFTSREVDKSYRVNGYPNLFVLDKDFKVLHVQIGYGPAVDAEIEKIIAEYLEKN